MVVISVSFVEKFVKVNVMKYIICNDMACRIKYSIREIKSVAIKYADSLPTTIQAEEDGRSSIVYICLKDMPTFSRTRS